MWESYLSRSIYINLRLDPEANYTLIRMQHQMHHLKPIELCRLPSAVTMLRPK